MKVLVNAASVKEGGPLVVLDQLIGRMRELRDEFEWVVATHPSIREHSTLRNFLQVDPGNVDSNAAGVLRWYEIGLPKIAERIGVDLVFSVTNYLPLRRLSVPTVLLVQHAGHFSKQFDDLTRKQLRRPDRIAAWLMKTRWVERSVRTATQVTVQTSALAEAIAKGTGRARESIHVIPHGPGAVTPGLTTRRHLCNTAIRIGYITKWGVQKNFRVLFAAAAQLIAKGRSIRIVLTLAEDLPENALLIRQANAAGVLFAIENAGEMDASGISALYDSLDLFVFPSLVESFGFPLVEAMAKGLPIAAADTPSNREVAGNAARFFPPTDADALSKILDELMATPAQRESLSAAALLRARDFSWRLAAQQTIALFERARGAAL